MNKKWRFRESLILMFSGERTHKVRKRVPLFEKQKNDKERANTCCRKKGGRKSIDIYRVHIWARNRTKKREQERTDINICRQNASFEWFNPPKKKKKNAFKMTESPPPWRVSKLWYGVYQTQSWIFCAPGLFQGLAVRQSSGAEEQLPKTTQHPASGEVGWERGGLRSGARREAWWWWWWWWWC